MMRQEINSGFKNQKQEPEIIAVKKDEHGILTDFKLNDGRVLSKEQAVELAKEVGIKGVNVGRTRGDNPQEILRANPTDKPEKALRNLPEFH